MATNDDNIASICRMIANHGQKGKHNHIMEGRNSRLDGLQAAVLLTKLPHLRDWTKSRQNHAQQLTSVLEHSLIITPKVRTQCEHVFHLFVVQVPDRMKLAQRLKEQGIETAVHYPVALPFLDCYKKYNYTEDQFPVAASFQNCIISMPMYAELTTREVDFIGNKVKQLV
jgi:dTDP-4-amino-4,6-dideoxygalactose transaminase